MKKSHPAEAEQTTIEPTAPIFGDRPIDLGYHTFLKLIVAVLLLLSFRNALAEPVTAEQARDAVIGWLKADQSPLQTKLGQQAMQVETFNDAQGAPLYHVVYLDPAGFVIVAGDDLVEPIISFAPTGRFDPSTANPLGALVSSDLPDRLAQVKGVSAANVKGGLLTARNKWEQLKVLEQTPVGVELGIASVSDVRISPLTQSKWSQTTSGGSACYNYYTPPNAEGSAANYPCGCVATAMAQLMRFWQYPVNGVGTASFTITVDSVSQSRSLRGGDGSGGAYVWANMVLNPAGGSTLAQRQAIGALCADAGVSVNMGYASAGSGSDTLQAKTAFVSTFGFANAVKGGTGSGNIGAGLNGMINPNLDGGCPVVLGITGSPGGHAVVCDGYGYNLSTLYHHLNLGWAGSDTAWYALPTIDTSSGTFTNVYKCVYNVWTNGSGEIISGRITEDNGTPVAGVLVTATRSGGGTYVATSNTNGIYALARIPASSTYTLSPTKTGYVFTNQTVITGQSTDYSATAGNRWGVNFAPSDTNNPTSFTATPASGNCINLSWAKNGAGDNVMVACNTNASFGTPAGTYAVGDSIAGGGTVLYSGAATTASHSGLSSGMTCYYRAWSIRSGPGYSSGIGCSATTTHDFQFTEGFEHGGSIPGGWIQEYAAGGVSWIFQNGGHSGYPASAHGGSYNALFYYGNYSDCRTKLVTPAIDFGTAIRNPQLTFWHCMTDWLGDQDYLQVYYKTSAGGAWNLLAAYTSGVTSWTLQTISLPTPGSTYYLGFEGDANYGYGVCIDDVTIVADAPGIAIPKINTRLSGTNLVLSCTNGLAWGNYYVLASTNLLAPANNWPAIATNCFDGIGCARFTNGIAPNAPQRYYRLKLP